MLASPEKLSVMLPGVEAENEMAVEVCSGVYGVRVEKAVEAHRCLEVRQRS